MSDLSYENVYEDCTLCPRACHADRRTGTGFCGAGAKLKLAKAMLHQWEEPCIAGKSGSGAIFFSGCTLKCIYCQNYDISHEGFGKEISEDRLKAIIYELQSQGAETVEFITASQYIPTLAAILEEVKQDISVPTVFNCGGYESVESLRMLDGLIDIYLPDVKYYSDELAVRLSNAPHYHETALMAVMEMIRQVGAPQYALDADKYAARACEGRTEETENLKQPPLRAESITTEPKMKNKNKIPAAQVTAEDAPAVNDDAGILQKGVIVRHLVLPGCRQDSIRLLETLAAKLGSKNFLISLMSQYTPFYKAKDIKELNRRVTSFEYDSVLRRAEELGLEGFMQEKSSAKEEYTPSFDLSGI